MSDKPWRFEHCKVTRVLDGDTVDFTCDLGFKVSINDRLRLESINCPETYRPMCAGELEFGKHVTEQVKELVLDKPVTIETKKQGIYNRYIGDVFFKDAGSEQLLSLVQVLTESGSCRGDLDCRLCKHMKSCNIIDKVYEELKLDWRETEVTEPVR